MYITPFDRSPVLSRFLKVHLIKLNLWILCMIPFIICLSYLIPTHQQGSSLSTDSSKYYYTSKNMKAMQKNEADFNYQRLFSKIYVL